MPDTPAADPLASTFDITLNDETYTFRKPSIRYRIELGYRAADVRRRGNPETGGALPMDYALDSFATTFARYAAILELYLVRASETWPFSPGSGGGPIVDFERFPEDREGTLFDLGATFEKEVARFRTRGNINGAPAGSQAVDSKQNPG